MVDTTSTWGTRRVGGQSPRALGLHLASYNGAGTAVTSAERRPARPARRTVPPATSTTWERFCGSAGRSAAACGENRHYPRVILDRWAPMYKTWLSR